MSEGGNAAFFGIEIQRLGSEPGVVAHGGVPGIGRAEGGQDAHLHAAQILGRNEHFVLFAMEVAQMEFPVA